MAVVETLMRVPGMLSGGAVTYALLTVAVTYILVKLVKRQRKVWLIEQIPGPKALPIIGNALEVNVDPTGIFNKILEWCDLTGKNGLNRVWLGPTKPYVFLHKAPLAEFILSSPKHLTKAIDYHYLHEWLGTGLLTADGSKWHQRRKLLTPAFHFKILEDFLDVFNQQSDVMVERLMPLSKNPATFDLFPYVTLCALDIILETAMGININAQNDSESDYVKAIYRMSNLIQMRQTRPWTQPNILYRLFGYRKKEDDNLKILHGLSNKVIKERRAKYIQKRKSGSTSALNEENEAIGKRKRLAFLDLLIESSLEGEHWTDEDIREEVDTFMFEGHDTTAAGINFAVYLMAANPHLQKKVHEELDDIFGDDRQRPVTPEDLRKMKYLECCIKESLRILPSVPFIGRELKEDTVIDGYTVPAGTTAMLIIYKLHRDPEQFPNPEHFDPDRFLPENSRDRHPYAYVPFSAGPRNCIGQKFAMMEEKTVLSSIFRNFRVETDIKREELRLTGELILRPEQGNFVKFYKR